VSALAPVFMEVVAMSWQAVWLILLLAAVRFILRRHIAPAMVFAGWLLVAGVLLMPLRLPVPWDPLGLGKTAKLRPAAPPAAVVYAAEPLMPEEGRAYSVQALGPVDAEAAAHRAQEHIGFDVFDVKVSTTRSVVGSAALVWLAGVAGLLLLRGLALVRLRRKLACSRLAVDGRIAAMVRQGCAALGIARMPEIVVTPMIGTPALCGVFLPQLLFPVGFADRLSAEELRWVVLHELGHLRRRDLLAQALLQFACAVHWFNPLVWVAAWLARHDCELACDAFVLRHAKADGGGDYGRTLLKVLGRTSGRNSLPAAVGIVEGKRQLLKRIMRIADYRRGHLRPVLVGAGLVGGFIFVGYTAPANRLVENQVNENAPVAGPATPALMRVGGDLSPEEQARHEAHRAESEARLAALQIEARAVGEVGGVPVAFIDVEGNPVIVMVGSSVAGYWVTSIDSARNEIVLTRAGQPARVLPVTNPRQPTFPALSEMRIQGLLGSANYVSAWERQLPRAVMLAWSKINREAKEEILLNYLQSGYVMTFVVTPESITGSPRRLFEERIRQEQQIRRAAFLESLMPEQRAAYEDGRMGVIRFTAPKEEQEAQAAAAKALQERQAEVIANLTPEQRFLFEAWQGSQQRMGSTLPFRP